MDGHGGGRWERKAGARRLAALGTLVALLGTCAGVLATSPQVAASTNPWSAATVPPPSSPPASIWDIDDLSCPPGGTCAAIGSYFVGSGERDVLFTGGPGSFSATQAPLPSGAYNAGELAAISCPSSGNCEAVGYYVDSSYSDQGLLLSESSGSWSASKAPLPSNAETALQQVWLFGVSCSSAGNCGAFGWYMNTSLRYQYMVLSEVAGAWTATAAPVPSGGSSASVDAIACPAAGSCVAVGSYDDSSGVTRGLLLDESSGSWSASTAPLPAGAAAKPSASLGAVTCVSSTSCEAAGSYEDASGNGDGLLLADVSGTWSASEAPLPAGAASSGQSVAIDSLSCTGGSCAAGGSYLDASGQQQALLLAESGGTWSASEAPLPAGAATSGQQATAWTVSCPAAGSCTVAGGYVDGSGNDDAMLLVLASGLWSVSVPPVPADAAADPGSYVAALSCAGTGSCAAIGDYDTSAGQEGYMTLSEVGGSWSAATAPLPSGVSPSPTASVRSVACQSAASCVAVGQYTDSAGNQDGLLLTGAPGGWAATQAPLPAGAGSQPDPQLSAVSCPAASSCVAVGTYSGTSYGQAMLLTESAGSWSATEAPAPPAAESVSLDALSCFSASSCVAVGSYTDASGDTDGELVTYASGATTAAEAPLPAGAAADPEVSITSVACASSTSCVAVGTYRDTSNASQGLLLSDSGGSWTASEAPLPAGANSGYPVANLASLSCPSPSSCTAVGTYYDSSYHSLPLLLTDTSGSWAAAEAPLPASAYSNPDAYFDSLSCPAAGSCVAAGYYYDSSQHRQGLLLSDTGGSWSARAAPLPAGTAANPMVTLGSVSCWSAGSCAVAGSYQDGSSDTQGLLLSDAQGAWTAVTAVLPTAASDDPAVTLPSIACVSPGFCAAAGDYADSNGGLDPLLETYGSASCISTAGGPPCALPVSVAVTAGTLSLDASPQLDWDVDLDGYEQWQPGSASALSACTSTGSGTSCSGATSPELEVLDATGSGSGWALSGYVSSSDLPGGSVLDFDGGAVTAGSSLNDPISAIPFAALAPSTTCDLGSTCTPASSASTCSHAALGVTSCPSYPVNLGAAGGASTQADLYSAAAGSGKGAVCFASGAATGRGCAGTATALSYDLGLPANAASGSFSTTVITLTVSAGP
jgi:hypothetical protein